MNLINKNHFVITIILLFSFVFYYCGCYTSYYETIEAEEIPQQRDYEFISLKLKDSTKVNLKDKGAKYFDVFRETPKVIAYTDTILKLYQLSQISKVKIEKPKFSPGYTLLMVGSIVVAVTAIIILFGLYVFKQEGPFR